MDPNLGPNGLSDKRVTEREQYPQGNDPIEQPAPRLEGGESVGERPQGRATEEAGASPLSPEIEAVKTPEYTLKQLQQSTHFMAPNHPPSSGPIGTCSCRDCRWYRLSDTDILTNLKALDELKALHQAGKIDRAGLEMGERTLFWWVPF